jgi:hypothetical protein
MPCGAGLCVRRHVALHYLMLNETGQRGCQLDRAGNSLLSGGDNDLAACACDVGLGVGLMKDLRLVHLIPPQRLTADYLSRLAEGISFSSIILDNIRGLRIEPRSLLGRALDLARAYLCPQPHRRIQLAAIRGRNAGIAHSNR